VPDPHRRRRRRLRIVGHVNGRRLSILAAVGLLIGIAWPSRTAAQDVAAPPTRTAEIEQAQAAKAAALHPLKPGRVEAALNRVEDLLVTGRLHVHPFFDSAYAGGGFTLGAGYITHVSSYNTLDVRGSITFSGYKRIEAAFLAPRLFDRRAVLNVVGGWREATQVGFFGIGNANTSNDDRANYSFDQPYGAATIDLWPTRKLLVLHGGIEVSQWNQGPGSGSAPSVETVYTPASLPGLGASPAYLHTSAGIGIDSRTSPGYARRGGAYGVTFHDFRDRGTQFGFRRTDYDAVQHIPILRDAWVLSLHGRVELANAAEAQAIPFFMLPALGGGSSLRGFSSWRFRDRNSLLLQADWRVLANRFLDMALFYDAGRVADRRDDLTKATLKSDYGLGFRLHSLVATPLRIDFAKSNEGLSIVFSSKAAF
jgi:Omp85 superfamily domain